MAKSCRMHVYEVLGERFVKPLSDQFYGAETLATTTYAREAIVEVNEIKRYDPEPMRATTVMQVSLEKYLRE